MPSLNVPLAAAYASSKLFFTSKSSFTSCGIPTPGLPEELALTALVD